MLSEKIFDVIDVLISQVVFQVGMLEVCYVNIVGCNWMLLQCIGKIFLFCEEVVNDEVVLLQLDYFCCEFESNFEELWCSGNNFFELVV